MSVPMCRRNVLIIYHPPDKTMFNHPETMSEFNDNMWIVHILIR